MPARHIAPSLGARGFSLQPGQWETGLSYRFLHSDDTFMGTRPVRAMKRAGTEPRLRIHSVDVLLRYGVTSRLSAALVLPVIASHQSVFHPDGGRHETDSGLRPGDLRLISNFWVLDPLEHTRGNLGLGLGLKVPTGTSRTTGTFFTPAGPVVSALDISQQPSDGGWGVLVEWQAFQALYESLAAYTAGFYLFNPRNTNGVEPPQSALGPAEPFFMSVPDQFSLRAGLALPVLPRQGLTASLGARWDGMPVTDVFGDSDGFRRPGSILFLDPGLTWTFPTNTLQPSGSTFFVSVPIALRREIKTSLLDESRGVPTMGSLADYVILAGLTRRF